MKNKLFLLKQLLSMSKDGRDSASLIYMQNSQLYRTALYIREHWLLSVVFAKVSDVLKRTFVAPLPKTENRRVRSPYPLECPWINAQAPTYYNFKSCW